MNFSRMRVATQLGLGFGLAMVLLALVTLFSLNRMADFRRLMQETTEINAVEGKLATKMNTSVTERALAYRNLILLDQPDEIQIEFKRIEKQAQEYGDAQDKLGRMFSTIPDTTADEKSLFDQIKQQAALAAPITARVQALIQANQKDEAYKVLRFEFRPIQKKWW
jgi:methyl-accepting chemotaxis protein